MINFDKHLKNLLYEQDFFIIPGLGAFIASYSQASLSELGELIPPFKTFDFNGLLNSDDTFKFINHVVQKENIPFEEVESQLNGFVFNIKDGLRTNKKMVLADVCDISKTSDGLLIASFDVTRNYYQRPDFSEATVVEQSNRVPEVVEPVAAMAMESEYAEENNYEEEETNYLKYLLYILPIILLLSGLWYMMFYKPFQKDELLVNEESQSAITDSLEVEKNVSIESEVNNENITHVDTSVIDREVIYQVAAGLFKSRTNAENLLDRMKKSGFDAKIKQINGMRRVYVGVSSMDEAEAMSKRIEKFTGEKSVYFDKNGISNR